MHQAAAPQARVSLLRRQSLIIGCLVIVTLFTFIPSLANGFVGIDDGLLITKNPIVLHLNARTLRAAFTSYDPELYIPLTFLTYQLEAATFGVHPFPFHLTNLLLHIGSVLLVFAVTRRLASFRLAPQDAQAVGLFCALLFAIHPLNTEAVVWAAARKDVLSTFFFFASFLFYLRFRSGGARRSLFVSILFFLLALLAKVSVLLLPFVLLLVDTVEGRRLTRTVWQEKLPYFGLAALFGAVALFGKQTQLLALNPFEKGLLACKATVFYLRSLFWPAGLTIFHQQGMSIALENPDLWFPPLVVLALVVVAVLAYRRRPFVFFGIAFYLLFLLPSFITFWKNSFVFFASERYAYIAMVGMLFALGTLILPPLSNALQQGSARGRFFGFFSGALLILVLAGLTVRQSRTWRDAIALNERALAVAPRSVQAMNNLGSAYFDEGAYQKALALFDRALVIDPTLPVAYANRGQTLRYLGDTEGALQAYAKGIDSLPQDRPPLPQDLSPFLRLSELLDELGRPQEATQVLRGAIQRLPQAPLPHYYLGMKEQQFGHLPEARDQFRLATTLDPGIADAFYRLAAVSAELGDLPGAVQALDRVLTLDPDNETAQEHLKNIKLLQAR
ncbi:MAG: tetratricopeptide repeat protein [Candidatus Peribacteraceae bacterium]|nr:tetratricopeptide repeat protein [Candidatus Peribacteraceae bacterium]MDD5741808.1 tetratricopeptide repeat protein [Candidatus Peribacteraceae bacterium]